MNCLLFRHGIAVSPEEWNGSERERPLTKDGIPKTEEAAEGLKRIGMQPTHILCSPFTRTRQTAEIAKRILQIKTDIQLCTELVYDQSPLLLFPVFHMLPKESFVLCVGHEPHLGHLAALMFIGKTVSGLSLKKAGACLISFDGSVEVGRGCLEWWMPPAQLRRLRKSGR